MFEPRLTPPKKDSPFYLSPQKGGINPCIVRNSDTGSVLPNCVGYAWGRVSEILGRACTLPTCNAENWYAGTSDGCQRGSEPKEGAVICWRKGEAFNAGDGAGHVAVVEKVLENGDVLCSNSDYYGRDFYTCTYKKAAGYRLGSAYSFQGFIYCPHREPLPRPVGRDAAEHQVQVLVQGLRIRKRPELSPGVLLGTAEPGIYPVLETRDMRHESSNGYLWYRIAEGCWVAAKPEEWTRELPAEDPQQKLQRLQDIIAEALEVLGRA